MFLFSYFAKHEAHFPDCLFKLFMFQFSVDLLFESSVW